MKRIIVVWWDGYREEFYVTKYRAGAYLLWMQLENGQGERRIPLDKVRWYSIDNRETARNHANKESV